MPVEIDFTKIPFFQLLDDDLRRLLQNKAEVLHLETGDMLFAEGEVSQWLMLLQSGKLILSRDAIPIGPAKHHELLDMFAVLGGLPHMQRAIAQTHCTVVRWAMSELIEISPFSGAMRRYLVQSLIQVEARLNVLEAPIHYMDDAAQLFTGPFILPNTTLIMALCDANLDFLRPKLPPGLTLFRAPWRKRDAVFIALAKFRGAYPTSNPNATFHYTETTIFVPIRYKRQLGFYPAYIYPSAYEPILLGREIYGFPKQLGRTVFDAHNTVTCSIDGFIHYQLAYQSTQSVSEPRLIRAMADWLGVEGRLTETAFFVGDILLNIMRVGLKRRISVFNHKRLLSIKATASNRVYDIDQLTQAIFTVQKWDCIEKLNGAELKILAGALQYAGVQLRESYKTQLTMRLSTGRILQDYRG